jgi:hypothetical protein
MSMSNSSMKRNTMGGTRWTGPAASARRASHATRTAIVTPSRNGTIVDT